MIELTHTPTRGRFKGVPQPLHRYPDGKYVVSSSKHERDYIRVSTQAEAIARINADPRLGGRFGDERPSYVKVIKR